MHLAKQMMAPLYDPDRFSNRRIRAELAQKQWLQAPLTQPSSSAMPSPQQHQQPPPTAPQNNSWLQKVLGAPPAMEWKTLPTNGWNKIAPPPIYPWNKVGYQDQVSGPPPTKAQNFAEVVEKSRTDCKTCQVAQPDLVPLGCSVATGDGEDLSVRGRQLVDHFRPFPGFNTPPIGENPVMITEPNRITKQGDNANIAPLFTHYDANLYKTPYDRSENMISTGVMVNPWTGTTFETFEKQLPPPTTSKYVIDKDQLKRTNPQLVWLNGGIDPNAPPPSKKEVCQDLPGPDGGPNVWGSQLYAEQIGQRIKQTVESQVWNNRNGIYSTDASFPKEAPAGYVGLQPVIRAIPYLPPTQRTSIDIKGWMGPVGDTFQNLGNNPIEQHGIVETRRIDLNSSGITHFGTANGYGGLEAEPVMPVVDPKPTWRGRTDEWVTGAVSANADQNMGGYVVQDTTVKDTLKGLNEVTLPTVTTQVAHDHYTGYVVQDTTVRDTLKGLNEEQFRINSPQTGSDQYTGYVVQDTTVRDTLKGMNEQQFRINSPQTSSDQYTGYVVQDTTVRDTLKGLNEEQFRVNNSQTAVDQYTGYVVQDTTVRETLKGLNEEQFRVNNSQTGPDQYGGYVVQDTTVKDTLKGLNEEQFPLTSTSATYSMPDTGYTLIDPTVRETLKGLNEEQFPLTSTSATYSMPDTGYTLIDPTVRETLKGLNEVNQPVRMVTVDRAQEGGYVVIDTVPRDTLKGLNELTLQGGLPSDPSTAQYIPFQGDMRIGPRRGFYSEDVPLTSAAFVPSGSGVNVGPAATTSRQNRGQDELYWTEPSQQVAGAGDSMTRWIGMQTRDVRHHEMGPSTPPANFTQENGVFMYAPRQMPLVFPNCVRPDDIDDEFLTIRPTYFGESVSA